MGRWGAFGAKGRYLPFFYNALCDFVCLFSIDSLKWSKLSWDVFLGLRLYAVYIQD